MESGLIAIRPTTLRPACRGRPSSARRSIGFAAGRRWSHANTMGPYAWKTARKSSCQWLPAPTRQRTTCDTTPWVGKRMFCALSTSIGRLGACDVRRLIRVVGEHFDPQATQARVVARRRVRYGSLSSHFVPPIDELTATFGPRFPKGNGVFLRDYDHLCPSGCRGDGQEGGAAWRRV